MVAAYPLEQIRMVDLLISSLLPCVLTCSSTPSDLACSCGFLRCMASLLSTPYCSVPARLRDSCCKPGGCTSSVVGQHRSRFLRDAVRPLCTRRMATRSGRPAETSCGAALAGRDGASGTLAVRLIPQDTRSRQIPIDGRRSPRSWEHAKCSYHVAATGEPPVGPRCRRQAASPVSARRRLSNLPMALCPR